MFCTKIILQHSSCYSHQPHPERKQIHPQLPRCIFGMKTQDATERKVEPIAISCYHHTKYPTNLSFRLPAFSITSSNSLWWKSHFVVFMKLSHDHESVFMKLDVMLTAEWRVCQTSLKPLFRHSNQSSHLKGNSIFAFTWAPILETSFTHWFSHSLHPIHQKTLWALFLNYFQNLASSHLQSFHLVWLSHSLSLRLVMGHHSGSSQVRLMLPIQGPRLGSKVPKCVSNRRIFQRRGETAKEEGIFGCE